MNSLAPSPPVPVAIIGMGCMFPQAEDLARYWANIRNCVDTITAIPESHWRPADYYDSDPLAADRTYAARGGFLTPVDFPLMEFGIAPHSIEATDTTQLLGLMVARAALDDAGYGVDRVFDRDRVSVILGVTGTLELVIPLGARLGHPNWRKALRDSGVDARTSEEVVRRIAESYPGWQENSFPGLLGNVAAGRIANRLDLRGSNCVVDAACASSLAAVNLAMLELSARRCDMVVTGGLDTFNDIFMYMCFSKTPALSPSGEARPFDAEADGTILGEGLGVLVLKRLEDARRDGDRVYAVIRAMGASSDGKGQAVYAPSAAGQAKALRAAYAQADVSPATIELVEAHGTGTKVGDATELAALAELYDRARAGSQWCALGSVKSQIGHTKAAAGAAGLIKAALALYHKVIPPSGKVRRPIEPLAREGSTFYLNTLARPWLPSAGHPRRAAVSAFGFGGSNFHCVLEEADPVKPGVDWDGDVQILAFSADEPAEIAAALSALAAPRDWALVRLEAAASRARFRPEMRHRLLLVAERSRSDLAALASEASAYLASQPDRRASAPARTGALRPGKSESARIFRGTGPPPGSLAMLFPGQGSQYVGMLRELACQFPRMQAALALADSVGGSEDAPLFWSIYPPPPFGNPRQIAQEQALRDTRCAQPAIAAVCLGLLRIMEDFGVHPDLAAGHSLGELCALCAGGRIDEKSLLWLAHRRGALMARVAGEAGAGGMLAVMAPLDELLAVLRDCALDVVIANKNAHRQYVLSGSQSEIERCRQACAERRIATQSLAVSAAFHSRFVAGAREAFREALDSIEPGAGAIPVFANSTAMPYPAEAGALRDLLASQLIQPVEFVAQVEAMYDAGARTFLEVGPDAKLTGLVRAILDGKEHVALAVDGTRGACGNLCDLACALATLAALGYAVDLKRWDETSCDRKEPQRRAGLTVKICGANARPQQVLGDEPREGLRLALPEPALAAPDARGATGPGFSAARRYMAAACSPPQPQDHKQSDRTASLDERMNTHRSNGQPRPTMSNNEPVTKRGAAAGAEMLCEKGSTRAFLAQALANARENFIALQKLAEQTADLHRQFLEGQEKSQETFLKLIEEEQRLSLALLQSSSTEGLSVPDSIGADDVPEAAGELTTTGGMASEAGPVGAPPEQKTGVAERSTDSAAGRIAQVVLEATAEKTGYPVEMLELDMKLDADLGIDSIKRVEIFSAIQERLPEAPLPGPEHVGALTTLREIVGFLGQAARESPAQEVNAGEPRGEEATRRELAQFLLEAVAEKTGYPIEMLELDMKLDVDLGIDSIKRVEILSAVQDRFTEAPALPAERLTSLRTLREIAEAFFDEVSASSTPRCDPPFRGGMGWEGNGVVHEALFENGPASTQGIVLRGLRPRAIPLQAPESRAPVGLRPGGLVWVTDEGSPLTAAVGAALVERGYTARIIKIEDEPPATANDELQALLLIAPREPTEKTFARRAFRLLRAAGPALERSGRHGHAALLTVSRMDGRFGVDGLAGEVSPASGALAGMAKTAAREWAGVHCKAVDLDVAFRAHDRAARLIVDELLARGPAEVGLAREGLVTVELAPALQLDARHSGTAPLEEGDLVVISGGARGITAEVAVALAAAYRPRLVLLGRSPAPLAGEASLDQLPTDAELKRALLARSASPLSPRELDEKARQAQAQHEIERNLARIAAAGSSAEYLSVDVRDKAAVMKALKHIRTAFGTVRGLIHGAGALADRRITDQTEEQFDLVYGTKVNGLHHLFGEIDPESLRLLVLFSSSTARFGRTGQVAYAAANEALNKWAQHQAERLPHCRVVAFNWGPWAGGMVTDSLRPLFEREGLTLIPLEEGARFAVEELRNAKPSSVEIVVLAEQDGQPGQRGPEPSSPRSAATPAAERKLKTVFRREVSRASLPVLNSHVIDGHAVLPFALLLEWLAEGAVQQNPGLLLHGMDNLRLLKGVILNDRPSATVEICAGKAVRRRDLYAVPLELRGTRVDGREVVHARAEVILSEHGSTGARQLDLGSLPVYPLSREEVYRAVLFHGEAMQGIEQVEGCGGRGVAGWVSSAPRPAEWIARPLREQWLTDPLAIDSAFQLVVLWCRASLGANSLPTALGSFRQFRRAFPAGRTRVCAGVRQASQARAVADIEFLDEEGELVARLDSYECVVDSSLNEAFLRNQLASPKGAARVSMVPS